MSQTYWCNNYSVPVIASEKKQADSGGREDQACCGLMPVFLLSSCACILQSR